MFLKDLATRCRVGAMSLARLWLCCVTLLVAACGGGGGGGGGDGLHITVNQTSITLSVEEGAPDGTGQVTVTAQATGSTSDAVYVGGAVTGTGVKTPIYMTLDTGAMTAYANIVPDASLSVGTYTGTITLMACRDPRCQSHYSGSPVSIPYTLHVTPRLKASAAQLSFVSNAGNRPAAQAMGVTLPAGAAASTFTVAYADAPGTSPWLDVLATDQGYSVQPLAVNGTGSYSATLNVHANGETVQVPVFYQVNAGMTVSPNQTDLTLDGTTAAGALSGEFAVQLESALDSDTWSAHSDQPWLQLDQASGAIGAPVRWRLDLPGLNALANDSVHEAVVTVSAPRVLARSWRLRLTKQLPKLLGIDTVAVMAGETGEVLVYGRRLNQLTSVATSVQATGFTPTQVTRLSDNLLSLQVPALAAGSHEIRMQTDLGLDMGQARLVVTPAQTYQEVWQDVAGEKGVVLWDSVSQAAFTVDVARRTVLRIQPTSAGSSTTLTLNSLAMPGLVGIGLSPDRSGVLALTAAGNLSTLSPQTLAVQSTRSLGVNVVNQPIHLSFPLTITGDRILYFRGTDTTGALQTYDLSSNSLLAPVLTGMVSGDGPRAWVSGDQRRLMLATGAAAQPRMERDALDLNFANIGGSPLYLPQSLISSDRRGTRWLLDYLTVADFQLNSQGSIASQFTGPSPAWVYWASAFSRDGTRLYVLARDSAMTTSRVLVYDTSAGVTELGGIALAQNASCLNPWACRYTPTSMTLTDDDRTLVIAGGLRVGLVPVPTALRAGVPSALGVRAPYRLSPATR